MPRIFEGGNEMTIKGMLLSLLAIGLTLMLSMAGFAYDAMPTPEDMGLNYSMTAGAAIAVKSHVPNPDSPTVGIAWYGPMNEANFGDMACLGLTGDWIGVKRADGQNVNLIPILLNYKQYAILSSYRVFVNLGVGIQFASDDLPEMRIQSGTSFAWTAGVGIDLTNRLFGNFRFIGGQNPGDDGVGAIELGYRF
jgi:hypothetical protein